MKLERLHLARVEACDSALGEFAACEVVDPERLLLPEMHEPDVRVDLFDEGQRLLVL